MAYTLLRSLLFRLSPETAHDVSLDLLSAAERLGLLNLFLRPVADCPVNVMGIDFPNPVGLAAGLDKNADYIDAMAALGFGFIEVGTVTPRPQPGNPKPRIFRIPERQAIINRMGFNNEGLDHLLAQVAKRKARVPLGINVGKNFSTPVESAADDYVKGISAVYGQADYITVNLSSPNTPGLRDLQFGDPLKQLLQAVKREQLKQEKEHGRYVPVAVKIAPDMAQDDIGLIANTLKEQGMDAVIATNTTLSREQVEGFEHANEAGGLSGAPLADRSTEVIEALHAELGDSLPIIGVGGIHNARTAGEKIAAGAKLVQIYTGFIYRGPALIREAVEGVMAAKRVSG